MTAFVGTGEFTPYLGSTALERIYVGSSLVWQSYQESIHAMSTSGSTVLTIPSWAKFADVAIIGGGGGGGGRRSGSTNTGKGGKAAAWQLATVDTSLLQANTDLTVTVGAGGAGGPTTSPNTGFAGDPTRVWVGTTLFSTATGGIGGEGHSGGSPTPGENSLSVSGFGTSFPGAAGGANGTGSLDALPGNDPGAGGGGAGGGLINPARAGGAGGAGSAWIRFRSS
ncbi:hypothetical protein SEA_SWITZERLAND_8 [Gordonia phage Switzerland]|uniref:Glycine-rich domain-containing protein n=1 Tax=Gordonia phage Soups TaxID=1838079 RepID=A0A160DFX3_9CAUD|nr:hypothetical protein BEN61_gp008 [Gordonia phage Rosalind]YP_009269309.1 hypothetical protein BEN59_gp008 [Gordonia phage Soups]QFP95076.1 hypothetical protein SEA_MINECRAFTSTEVE_9 [Gordonia phage MinecraftSteve]UOK18064.1 hypothetical protein SEA_SWITZERLAND_8 [Gordonia phage Switzerland]WIC40103.1 hypothetical protein SEA_BATTLESHIP_9 [Gordonia phage Battleship]ANA86946.1 hypothetical protein PBI_SOUPS_8 [Gordonia phage Soups]ANA87045.1 hypothetical protein PBI_ROSALIND_8 [Gordonia phage